MAKYRSLQQIREQLLLSQQESLLLRLLFHQADPVQERELYENLVFDDQKQSFLLLLARLAKRDQYANTPDALVPRLQGLLRYHGVNNKLVMQPVAALLDGLGDQQAMLYSHSAMYAYYDRENPRIMGIGDVCTAPGKAEMALQAAEIAGFEIQSQSSLAAFLKCTQGNVNLHKILHLQADPQIWQHCQPIQFQNRPALVPDCVDTLILLLRSEFRWLCILPKHASNIKWYYDCACLLQHPAFPGWDVLSARAKESGSVQTVHFMLSLFDQSMPGWVPEGSFDQPLPRRKKKQLALALQYGTMEKQYEDARARSRVARVVRWFPWMRTKYHYLNSEVSFSNRPVSLCCMLKQHWGVSSLLRLPALFWTRLKRKFRRKG